MTNLISALFGQSPIRPIQKHMEKATEAVRMLPAFIESAHNDDWQQALETYKAIERHESDADKMKMEIRLHLPKSLFLPVARGDLLELLTTQDKIANLSKSISGLMLGREMQFPTSLQPQFTAFVKAAVITAEHALTTVKELDELIETGFQGREIALVEEMIAKLDDLEDKADHQEVDIRNQLFNVEESLPPIEAMFLYRVIEDIGRLADVAQNVGDRLSILIAR